MHTTPTTFLDTIRAVIFDMDGTLVLTNGLHFDAYQKVFSRYGISADYEDFVQNLVGIGAYNVLKTVFERNGMKKDYTELALIKRDLFNEMVEHTEPRVVDGLYDFLDLLEVRNISRAVGSAANKDSIIAVLKSIAIESRIPVVVSCEEVPLPKPAPDVFLEAARQLNVLPHECMVIEDTAHGIAAAHAAGMIPVGLLTSQAGARLTAAGAQYLCKNFFEVKDLFGATRR